MVLIPFSSIPTSDAASASSLANSSSLLHATLQPRLHRPSTRITRCHNRLLPDRLYLLDDRPLHLDDAVLYLIIDAARSVASKPCVRPLSSLLLLLHVPKVDEHGDPRWRWMSSNVCWAMPNQTLRFTQVNLSYEVLRLPRSVPS
jgi:hypothetical protein